MKSGKNAEETGSLQDQQSLMDHLPFHVWFMQDVETVGRVNGELADFFGVPREKLEGKALGEIMPPDLAEACRASSRLAWDSGQTVRTEEWQTDALGRKRLIAITKTPSFGAGGAVAHLVCCGIDVTEQREAESLLTTGEENFRTFIETMDDIVVIGDTDGRIVYCNPAATAKLEYSPEQLRKMGILELHPEWVRQEAEKTLADMFAGKRDCCPLPLISRSGRLVPVETRVQFGKWNGGDCIFGICKDLSKEQESLQKFEKLFRTNPALMAISDLPDRRFTDVNDAFMRVLGYEHDEVIGKTVKDIGLFPDQAQQDRAAGMLAKYGFIRGIEMPVRARNGGLHTGLFSGEIVESQGKKHFLTVMVDITESRKAAAEREEVIQELQLALEQIKTLRGIVPICASCKKIRDDQGYWEQVDAYLARHTEAQFSHGICPECLKNLYPGYSPGEQG